MIKLTDILKELKINTPKPDLEILINENIEQIRRILHVDKVDYIKIFKNMVVVAVINAPDDPYDWKGDRYVYFFAYDKKTLIDSMEDFDELIHEMVINKYTLYYYIL